MPSWATQTYRFWFCGWVEFFEPGRGGAGAKAKPALASMTSRIRGAISIFPPSSSGSKAGQDFARPRRRSYPSAEAARSEYRGQELLCRRGVPFHAPGQCGGRRRHHLDGSAGPINPADTAASPVNANLKIEGLDLAGSGFTQSAPALAGVVGFEGSGQNGGESPASKGS